MLKLFRIHHQNSEITMHTNVNFILVCMAQNDPTFGHLLKSAHVCHLYTTISRPIYHTFKTKLHIWIPDFNLNPYVSMYVCMCLCVHACMRGCVHALCVGACMYVCIIYTCISKVYKDPKTHCQIVKQHKQPYK